MPISDTDLLWIGSANMVEDNSSTTGGASDDTIKVIFTDIATTDNVRVVSSNAADTMNISIYGRSAAGAIISETLALNGTTPVVGSNNYERIMKIVLASAAAGVVSLTRDNSPTYTAIATLEAGVTEIRRLFYGASAEATGGSTRTFTEKVFLLNNHSTLALNSVVISEDSDPSTYVSFTLENSLDGSETIASRLNTTPSNITEAFSNGDKSIPGGVLGPGEACGVWIRLTLLAGTAPSKNVWGVGVTGTST